MQYFNIQMASQLSGVATATIRAWEKRYQAVTPERAENRHRLYSEEDIEKLSLLAKLTDFGQNIGKIARLDLEELKKVYTVLMRKPYRKEDVISSSKEKLNFHKSLTSLSLAISSMKMDVIAHELKKIRLALDAKEVALNIIPSLHKIIETKASNKEINNGEQLAIYNIIFHQFSTYLADYEYPQGPKPPLILSAPINGIAQLNLLGTALLCMHYNKNFLYLVGSSSSRALAEAINHFQGKSILLEADDYQINQEMSLDHYLDELLRMQERSAQIYIFGQDHLRQSIRRKNCIFIRSLQEIEEMLIAGLL